MKAPLKFLVTLVLVVVGLYLVVVNFSAVPTRYECPGEFAREGMTEPTTIFFRLERYRWWVGLWSDSDGNLRLEVPNEWVDYYSDVIGVGDQLGIRKDGEIAGNFSTLSGAFALRMNRGFFDGVCTRIEN